MILAKIDISEVSKVRKKIPSYNRTPIEKK